MPQPVEKPANTPRIAKPKELLAAIDSMPDSYVECRDFSHQWRQADVERGPNGTKLRKLYCPRCKQNKTQTLKNGVVLEEHRDYPEGYLIKGLGYVRSDGKAAIRDAQMERALTKSEQRQAAAAERRSAAEPVRDLRTTGKGKTTKKGSR